MQNAPTDLIPLTALPPSTQVNCESLVEAFLQGRTARTLQAYRQDLNDFRQFSKASTFPDTARMLLGQGQGQANLTVLQYRSHLVDRGLQPATVNRRLAAIRSLVRLARTLGLVAWTVELRNIRASGYRDTRGPGKQAFRTMLADVSATVSKKAIRDRAILRLLYDLALRCGEVVSLDGKDVDLPGSVVWVRGKGMASKQMLTLPEPTKAALSAWFKERGDAEGPLFTNLDRARKGHRLTGVSVYRIVRNLGQRNGFKVRPHGLRHTAITEACKIAAANGIGLEEVLDFSRHSRRSVAILMVYRDRERNVQGQIASMIAAEASLSASA